MFCALTNEQVRQYYGYVYKFIRESEGKEFSVDSFVKNIYDKIFEKSKNEGLALTYAALVPQNIFSAFTSNENVRNIIYANNINLNDLGKLIDTWKNPNTIKDYIQSLQSNESTSLRDKVIDANTTTPDFTPEEEYTAIEQSPRLDGFSAKVDRATTSTGLETIHQRTSEIDPDPIKRTFYNTIANLNKKLSEQKVDPARLVLTKPDGTKVTGLTYVVVHDTGIPLNNLPKNSTHAGVEGHVSGVYLVVADGEGKYIDFNEKGEVVNDGTGKLAITTMRKPVLLSNGEFELKWKDGRDQIQTPEEILERVMKTNPDDPELQDPTHALELIRLHQQTEIKQLYYIRQAILRNPESVIVMPITDINDGMINIDYKGFTPLTELKENSDFKFTVSKVNTEDGSLRSGGVYFNIPGVLNNVLVIRPLVPKSINDTIINLLSRTYPNQEQGIKAIDYIKKLIYTKKDALEFKYNYKTNTITILLNKQIIPNDVHGLEKISKELQKRKLNINNSLINKNFNLLSIDEKDNIVTTPTGYNKFILNNFGTNIIPNENGEVKPVNAYMEFEVGNDIRDLVNMEEEYKKLNPVTKNSNVKTELTEPSKITLTENEPSALDKLKEEQAKELDDLSKTLFKTKAISNVATPKQIQEAHDWFNNSSLSKYITFNNLMDIVNSNAFGTFTSNGITLYKGANYTDLYHEAWHGFSQMFLTPEERSNLYNEIRKTSEYKDMSNREIEEVLAEDFRKYVLSDSKNVLDAKPIRNSLFRRILNFLKSLFGDKSYEELNTETNTRSLVHELYEKLHKGQLNKYTPNIKNAEFGILNKINSRDGSKVLSHKESQLISDSIDSIINDIFNKTNKSISNLFEQKNMLSKIYEFVKRDLEMKVLSPETTDYQKQLLQFAIDNFKNVIKYHSGTKEEQGRSKYLSSIKSVASHFDDVGNLIEDGPIEDGDDSSDEGLSRGKDSLGAKNGNEESTVALANNETLYLVSGLFEMDKKNPFIINEQGKKVPNYVKNELDYPKLVDFNKTWNNLIKTLEGSLDPQEIRTRLFTASKDFPEFADLALKLGDPGDSKNLIHFNTITKFWQDFNKTRVPIYEGYIERQEDGSFLYKFKEATPGVDKLRMLFTDKFQTAITNPYTYVDEKDKINILNTQKLINDFGVKIYSKSYNDTHNADKSLKAVSEVPFVYGIKKGKELEFLKVLGIELSNKKEIKKVINNIELNYLIQTLSTLNDANFKINNPIEALQAPVYDNKKRLTDGQGSIIRTLLETEAKISDDFSNYSVINAEGNLEYEHSLNNFLTIIVNHLNNSTKYETYNDLIKEKMFSRYNIDKNPLIRNNTLLNSLFYMDTLNDKGEFDITDSKFGQRRTDRNGEFVKLELANYNGVKLISKDSSTDEGIKTTSLDRTSKMLQDINSMLGYGMMELPRHASKSSAFALRATELNSNTIDTHLYFPIESFMSKTSIIDGDVYRMVKNYLVNELTRVKWAQRGLSEKDIDRILFINSKEKEINFDKTELKKLIKERDEIIQKGEGVGKNIPGYNSRSLSLNFFDDILRPDLKDALIKELFNIDEENINALVTKYDKRISIEVKQYFNKIEAENLKELQRSPHFSNELTAKLNEIARNREISLTSDNRTEIINRAFTYNAWINNVETINFIYGDLAFYKTEKEEFHKRNTAYSATGTIPRTDTSAINFINSIGRHYAKHLGIEEKHFNGTFDTAVVKDMNISTVYDKQYEDLFRNYFTELSKNVKKEDRQKYIDDNVKEVMAAYRNMTEGDAQGWITLDAYRILKTLQGKWGYDSENLYMRMVNGEILSQFETAQMLVPIKAQYAGPLESDLLAVPGFHKFSLMPLIPSLIKNTSFEHINRNFMEKGIDYALFESGSKIATITKDGEYDKLYDDYDKKTPYTGDYQKNTVYLQYLKEQVEIANHFKDKVIFSTQLRKLLINNLYKNGVAINEKAKQLDASFVDNINRLTQLKKIELMKETRVHIDGDGNYIVDDYKPLVTVLKKELTSRDMPDNVLDFVDVIPHVTETGKTVYKLKNPLDLSTSSQKIETMLQSIVNNRLVRQKVNGEPLIQLACSGFESNDSRNRDYKNPTDAEREKYGDNDLPFYVPSGRTLSDGTKVTSAMKIKRAIKEDESKVLFQLKHTDNNIIGTLERLNEVIKQEAWLNKDNNRSFVQMVGVRIPVQGLNSMEFMEVHHFLPTECGNIIIPPSGIVAKSGSDFDIDKLSIFFPNIALLDGKPLLFSKESHNLTNEELNDKYRIKIAAAKLETERVWNKYQEGFKELEQHLPLDSEGRKELERLKTQFYKKQSFLQKEIANLNDDYVNYKAGSNSMSYEEYKESEDLLANLYSELNELRAGHRHNMKVYERAYKDFHKDQYKIQRDLEMNPVDTTLQKLHVEKKFMRDSAIKAVENSLIDNIRSILEMSENVVDLLRPNGTDIVKPIADKLANRVSEYNARMSKITGELTKTVSPTRVLETRYNLYKHESNSIGKATLGVGAIDNTFNALLNKVGAYLNTTYNKEKKGKIITVPVHIMLDHNKLIVDGKEHISLSHIYDIDNKNKIGDVISQLINGWVDIEKDAWIFNINGCIEAAPAMLLLNQAGVPFDLLAKFITQPAILQYVRTLQTKNNLFDKSSDPKRYKFFTNSVQKEMFEQLLGVQLFSVDDVDSILNTTQHKVLFIDKQLSEEKTTAKIQAVYLKHFIELTNLGNTLGVIKQALNFDTSKSKNLFDAQLKINKYGEAQNSNLLPGSILNELRHNSVISSFAVQNFSIKLWTKLLPLRNNALVNEYIVEKIKDLPMETRSKNSEKMGRIFKNDLMEYILQQYGLPESWKKNNGQYWKNLFFGDPNITNELYNIKNNVELSNKYTLIQNLIRNTSKKEYNDIKGLFINNIKLIDSTLDTGKINNYAEQFEELTNIDIKKSDDPIENKRITNFFKNLAVFGFLQSGLNKSPISFTEIIPQGIYTKLLQSPLVEISSNVTKKFLDDFYNKFKLQNPLLFGIESSKEGYRLKDFTDNTFLSNTLKSSNIITPSNLSINDFINHSGGANGGDKTFDEEGRKIGINNHNHYTIEYYDKLAQSVKNILDKQYIESAKFLGRNIISSDSRSGKLVRRDMIQANKGDAIFGITELIKPNVTGRKGYINKMSYSIPEGGTGYAVARGILSNKSTYVFNQSDKYGNEIGWYKWDTTSNDFIKTVQPILTKNFTGIGTQELNEIGKKAIKDLYSNTIKSLNISSISKNVSSKITSQIYSQLGNKTQSENVVLSNVQTKDNKYDRDANIKIAKDNNRIYSMETSSNLSFSNPWASFNRKETIKTNSTKEAVQNYIDWLTTDKFKDINSERKNWILNQLKTGELKNKIIQYYTELKEPSHATALDYLINKYDWNNKKEVVNNSVNSNKEEINTELTKNGLDKSKVEELSKIPDWDSNPTIETVTPTSEAMIRYQKETNSDVTKYEDEFFKNNIEFGNKFINEYLKDPASDGVTIVEYAKQLLTSTTPFYENIDSKVGEIFTIDNQKLRLLSVKENEYDDGKVATFQTKSGQILAINVNESDEGFYAKTNTNKESFFNEQTKSGIFVHELGITKDEYNDLTDREKQELKNCN